MAVCIGSLFVGPRQATGDVENLDQIFVGEIRCLPEELVDFVGSRCVLRSSNDLARSDSGIRGVLLYGVRTLGLEAGTFAGPAPLPSLASVVQAAVDTALGCCATRVGPCATSR